VAIELPKEAKRELIASIKRYCRERMELDEEVGDLKAELLLDFCLREICPTVYNRAIRDAQAYFHDRVADLEGSCFEPEQMYWEQRSPAPRAARRPPGDPPPQPAQ
jgi:uncharacterized protein (DUF2164 family)